MHVELRRRVPSNVIVKIEDVRKTYRTGRGEVHALDGVNLEIYRGEYISVMGPSGSGKSTLFNMIGALDRPTGGKVEIGAEFGIGAHHFQPVRLADAGLA